jgi:phosphoserine phosphatase
MTKPLPQKKSNKLHVFDLDGTLLTNNCSFAFSLYLYRKGVFSLFDELYCLFVTLAYKYLGLPLEKLHKGVFKRLFFKKKLSLFKNEASMFIPIYLPKAINCLVSKRIEEAKIRGENILLLSSSPMVLVEPISQYFDIAFKSTEYSVDNEGNLKNITLIMSGKKKAEIIEKITKEYLIDKDDITAYSDHIDDLPLLSTVGKAVVVNPSLKLRQIAKNNCWEII